MGKKKKRNRQYNKTNNSKNFKNSNGNYDNSVNNNSYNTTNNYVENNYYVSYFSENEKETKKKLENADRYGLREEIDAGRGMELIYCTALVRPKYPRNINNEDKYLVINPHSKDGKFMSDHIYVNADAIDEARKRFISTHGLLYIGLIGRPYNYNEEKRLDGISINIKDKPGMAIVASQTIYITELKQYIIQHDNDGIIEWLKEIPGEKYLVLIEYLKRKINDIVNGITNNFIYDYVLWSFLLKCSHKELYLNTLNLGKLDYDILIDLILLLSSIIYELQCRDNVSVEIEDLFENIGYNITAMQEIYNFSGYSSNPRFKNFEAMIGKSNSWYLIEYRKENLDLKWNKLIQKVEVKAKGLAVLRELKGRILDYMYMKR